MNALLAQAKANTEKLEDQTKVQEGGFEYETPPAGLTPARFIGYVEVGVRPQNPFQGKEKPDADEVRLYFELNGPKHQRKAEVDGKEQTFTNMIAIKLTKKLSDKAGFTKLFRKMTYGREDITHMAHMLGEGFLINVIHNVVKGKEGAKDRTYANMKDSDGTWTISAPVVSDPLTGDTTNVPIPEATQPIRLLLWDAPSQEQWDSIFIDGTKTVKDEDGAEKEVSKNWLQEDIITNAKNFEGSALQALLGGVADLDLNDDVVDEGDKEQGNESAPAEKGTQAGETESAGTADQGESKENSNKSSNESNTKKEGSNVSAGTAADLMAELGLT